MRKKRFTKNVGILISNEIYDLLVEVTDREEVTISKFVRQLIEERLNTEGKEKFNE
jgi:hypothetical protein